MKIVKCRNSSNIPQQMNNKMHCDRALQWNAAAAKSLQSCPTLRNPVDGSPTGFPIPGILQARTLEWVAISFSTMECYLETKWSNLVMHTIGMNLKNAMLRKKPGTIDNSRLFTRGSGTGKMNCLGSQNCGAYGNDGKRL